VPLMLASMTHQRSGDDIAVIFDKRGCAQQDPPSGGQAGL